MNATNPKPPPPRFLDYRQSMILRNAIDTAIANVRAELELEGAADPRTMDHEIALALARAACRFDLDLLHGSAATIERLEAVVAELGARLEAAKIAQAVER